MKKILTFILLAGCLTVPAFAETPELPKQFLGHWAVSEVDADPMLHGHWPVPPTKETKEFCSANLLEGEYIIESRTLTTTNSSTGHQTCKYTSIDFLSSTDVDIKVSCTSTEISKFSSRYILSLLTSPTSLVDPGLPFRGPELWVIWVGEFKGKLDHCAFEEH